MARILRCEIPKWSQFERKHYFYADMPAGYQITQNDYPIAKNGIFRFWVFDEKFEKPYWKEVEILQLQLEQDSGKTIHLPESLESGPSKSLIDYNRAGCPLIEIVTSPCFETGIEAIRFVQTLRLLLIHHNLCDGELHKGHLRVDANVSLSKDLEPGTRIEIKNMNSIRTIHTAINFEIARQFEILRNSGEIQNETRAADPMGRTVSMRFKEKKADYRFMIEPNLPKLRIKDTWIKGAEDELRGEGKADFEWLREEYGFDARSSIHIAEEPQLLSFVKRILKYKKADVKAEDIIFWMRELKTIMQRSKVNYPPQSDFFARQFSSLLHFQSRLTRLRLLDLLRFYAISEENHLEELEEFIGSNNFFKIENPQKIDEFVEKMMKKHEKLAGKLRENSNFESKNFKKMRNLMVDESEKCIELEDLEAAISRFLNKN